MPGVDVVVECRVHDSFRVRQVAGMFDLPVTTTVRKRFAAEAPAADEEWRIGAVIGPSGSGKSTIAKQAYGEAYVVNGDWPTDRAVVDGFDIGLSVRQVVSALTAVGFSSPPAWIKPYSVLSNGERFRCDLARSLLCKRPVVVFDEFTSMVDRTVARAASHAVAKAVRADRCCEKFVAVTCHEDILPWLEPDWVLDMRTGLLTRRRLRRPGIEIELFRCDRSAWRMFAPHHYLSDRLHPACRCYAACWDGVAVAFVAVLHAAGYVGRDRVSRLVVSGDYQGIGIGSRVLDAVCALHAAMGRVIGITTSHPMLINGLKKNKNWKCRAIKKTGGSAHGGWGKAGRRRVTSSGRAVVAFDYIGGWKEAADRSATDTRHGNAGCYRVGDSGDIEMQPGSFEKARR